jgi:hypothetical protein
MRNFMDLSNQNSAGTGHEGMPDAQDAETANLKDGSWEGRRRIEGDRALLHKSKNIKQLFGVPSWLSLVDSGYTHFPQYHRQV